MVEDNTFSVSVHYRMVAEGEDRERVNEEVDQLVADMPMLRKTYGKMVYELRPSVDWHKGKAVEWLMEQFKKSSEDDTIFPVYIGDDVTDEDAFAIMGGLGGVGIIVSETLGRGLSRETSARYGLRNPAEVVQFLEHFIGDDRAESTHSTHASSAGDFAPIRAAHGRDRTPPGGRLADRSPAPIARATSATTISARDFVS